MVNHFYDEATDKTRCGEYGAELAYAISANGAVSCPECLDALTQPERVDPLEGEERTITVSAFGLDDAALDALFNRVADAAHALDEEVFCSTSHGVVPPRDTEEA